MVRALIQSPLMLLTLLLLFMGMGQGMSHAACNNELCLPAEDMNLCGEGTCLGESDCPLAGSHRHHQAASPVLRCETGHVVVPQPLPAADEPTPAPVLRHSLILAQLSEAMPRAPEALLHSWRPLLL